MNLRKWTSRVSRVWASLRSMDLVRRCSEARPRSSQVGYLKAEIGGRYANRDDQLIIVSTRRCHLLAFLDARCHLRSYSKLRAAIPPGYQALCPWAVHKKICPVHAQACCFCNEYSSNTYRMFALLCSLLRGRAYFERTRANFNMGIFALHASMQILCSRLL